MTFRGFPATLAVLLIFSSAVVRADPPQNANQQSAPPDSSIGTETVEQDVTFGPDKNSPLRLDVYKPADLSQLHPAVILIHGGGWISFDKSTMRGMGAFLSRSGFVAFAVDYRLFAGKENRWPAQLDDVQRAVRWIRANATKYHVNPEHIGAFGHSAGAQLAALLGMEDTRDNSDVGLAKYSSRVQAVVDVSGPVDFTKDHDADAREFLTSFLGADFGQHPEVWRDASPVFHADSNSAPFLIVHGTRDQSVPIAQSQELADKLKAAKVPESFIQLDDEHTFKTPEARHRLAIETREFFAHYLR